MVTAHDSALLTPARFAGRIDRRLSFVFGVLFALVLIVGAGSLYLLGSLLLRSDAIARQSEQVHLAERAHAALERFLGTVEEARREGHAIPDAARAASSAELESLVTRYLALGGAPQDFREMQQIIAEAHVLSERVGRRSPDAAPTASSEPAVLRATQQRMETLAERISAGHKATEQRQVELAHRTLLLTIAIDVAFVVVGAGLVLGARRYFHRAIGVPLRRLADRAGHIATGESCEPIPVTSSDEIGGLTDAFNRMAEKLSEHEEQLKRLVTLEERQRLARELHDNLAQDLALLRLKLIEADQRLATGVADSRTLVGEVLPALDAGYENLREAIFGLQALDPKTPGELIGSLGAYLGDFSEMRKIPVELQAPGCEALVVSPPAQTQLIRIIHEALSNIVRHAGATRATVRIERIGTHIRVTIADDGRGFVPAAAGSDGRHLGLRTMQERAESVGGTLVIRTLPGYGTQVVLELPATGA